MKRQNNNGYISNQIIENQISSKQVFEENWFVPNTKILFNNNIDDVRMIKLLQ